MPNKGGLGCIPCILAVTHPSIFSHQSRYAVSWEQTAPQPALGLGTVTQQRPRTRGVGVNSMSAGGARRPRHDDFLQFGSVLCGEYFDHKRKSGISLLKHFAWLYKRRSEDNRQFSISRRDETQKLLGNRRNAAGTEIKKKKVYSLSSSLQIYFGRVQLRRRELQQGLASPSPVRRVFMYSVWAVPSSWVTPRAANTASPQENTGPVMSLWDRQS